MAAGKGKQIYKVVVSLGATYAVSAVGAVASISAKSFYSDLNQPGWAPPAYVFGPVWTILYTMMAIATWLVWRRVKTGSVSKELTVYGAQLAVNGLWSWLFFKWNLGPAAFIDILLLLGLIVLNVFMYWRLNKWAGLLLLPYLAWVAFAAALCFAVWQLNPEELG
ncbi:TspO/MBR family protein [Pelagicoccus sp. SDUM812002]|uniref:TspO/MBR family protein n=1 Tax=Pelagicoccus sp. SDUM812002 TaxID=3041266 RepID=UPI00280C8129|nr:TspO/MBR family protein [Pelagicoccus sp. SDUM812002]MDQ8186775.1 tryptophan-rich sensory protein [Pelagicoccus sp. SDUM812002]